MVYWDDMDDAVSLFVDRAAAAAPGFVLDDENAEDVARICLRLDGLPLALELAAGRIGALTPAAIAARLDDRFALLRTGSLAAPTRQQTLGAALDWSHDLLEPDESALFRRLAIFSGAPSTRNCCTLPSPSGFAVTWCGTAKFSVWLSRSARMASAA